MRRAKKDDEAEKKLGFRVREMSSSRLWSGRGKKDLLSISNGRRQVSLHT